MVMFLCKNCAPLINEKVMNFKKDLFLLSRKASKTSRGAVEMDPVNQPEKN